MASNVGTITVTGNLTRDPELRYTAGGVGVVSVGIAHNRRWQQNGEWQEKTSFFNVSAFGQLAENVAQSVRRGDRILVTGRLEQRDYETNDGEKRSVLEIVADDVAPSLTYATCSVERNPRTETGNGR